jgi:hypothetical protein
MKQLGKDLHEAMQFRKRLDQLTREGRADELFRNEGLYNNVEKELVRADNFRKKELVSDREIPKMRSRRSKSTTI